MSDLTIQIELDSPVPVYRQVVDQFRIHLNSATLIPGDSLPSVRVLATRLGVHFNTIAEAYRELAQEGWIELSRGRCATVVVKGAPRRLQEDEAASLLQRLRHLLVEMSLKGVSANAVHNEVSTLFER